MPGMQKPHWIAPARTKACWIEVRAVRRAEALDGGDLGALERGDLRDAREDGLAVDEDRAGAALALAVAGLLGAGQAEVLAEQVEQDGLLLVGHDLRRVDR